MPLYSIVGKATYCLHAEPCSMHRNGRRWFDLGSFQLRRPHVQLQSLIAAACHRHIPVDLAGCTRLALAARARSFRNIGLCPWRCSLILGLGSGLRLDVGSGLGFGSELGLGLRLWLGQSRTAPGMGKTSSPCAWTHASASCPGRQPFFSANAFILSTMARFCGAADRQDHKRRRVCPIWTHSDNNMLHPRDALNLWAAGEGRRVYIRQLSRKPEAKHHLLYTSAIQQGCATTGSRPP